MLLLLEQRPKANLALHSKATSPSASHRHTPSHWSHLTQRDPAEGGTVGILAHSCHSCTALPGELTWPLSPPTAIPVMAQC